MSKKRSVNPNTYREHFYHISRLGAFSLVHIMRRKPSTVDPKVSLCENVRTFKTPSLSSEVDAHKAIDHIVEGKLERLPSSHTAFPLPVG